MILRKIGIVVLVLLTITLLRMCQMQIVRQYFPIKKRKLFLLNDSTISSPTTSTTAAVVAKTPVITLSPPIASVVDKATTNKGQIQQQQESIDGTEAVGGSASSFMTGDDANKKLSYDQHEEVEGNSTAAEAKDRKRKKQRKDLDWDDISIIEPPQTRPCPHTLPHFVNLGSNVTIFSLTRRDRSGSIVKHMLAVYYYAYKHGFTYGGGDTKSYYFDMWRNDRPYRGSRKKEHQQRKQDTEEVIDALGLSHILTFKNQFNHSDDDWPSTNWFLIGSEDCGVHNEALDDPVFIEHVRSQQQRTQRRLPTTSTANIKMMTTTKTKSTTTATRTTLSVVIHIRRGDVQPCAGRVTRTGEIPRVDKYMPNAYYLRILDEYLLADHDKDENDVVVTVFSESDSFETFDVFYQRGYNVVLDGSMADAWSAMVTADVLITSPDSGFSYVPAILNRNIVYNYANTDEEYHHHQHWKAVDQQIYNDGKFMIKQLADELCPIYLEHHDEHNTNNQFKFYLYSDNNENESNNIDVHVTTASDAKVRQTTSRKRRRTK